MPSPKILNPELVRSQLEKILSSTAFARNDRLRGFLRFVVERELSGRADELKESVIGVEFLGRPADYDVRQDSVVRNEAAKLRSRLAEYYVAEGAADELIIDLPKGVTNPHSGWWKRQLFRSLTVAGPGASRGSGWRWLWPDAPLRRDYGGR